MTYEEILNIDWAEQKDLTEYASLFEQASTLQSQLTSFSYRYLRGKLMTWEEMVEEGLENFNFFNFSSFRFSGIVNGLRKYYVGIIPRCKLLDHDLDYGYQSRIYFQDFIGKDLIFYGQGIKWIKGDLEEALKRATEKDPDSPQLLFSAELLSYLIESRRSLDYCSLPDKPNYFNEEEMKEIIQIINNHPLITLIETDEEHIYKCEFEYYCNHHYVSLLFNQYAIDLGLNRKLSDLQDMFGAWIDENIVRSRRKYKYYGEYHPYEENSLYWINKLGQPIFLTNESRFNQDYCSTKVDLEEGLVEFFFKNPIPPYKRGDNSLVYEEYSNYRYSSFEKIIIDFVNDKIIGNERRIDY